LYRLLDCCSILFISNKICIKLKWAMTRNLKAHANFQFELEKLKMYCGKSANILLSCGFAIFTM